MSRTEQAIRSFIRNPGCHTWLREAAEELLTKDPADAANDSEQLAAMMKDWCEEILTR